MLVSVVDYLDIPATDIVDVLANFPGWSSCCVCMFMETFLVAIGYLTCLTESKAKELKSY